jgi:iron complex outermembrane receptor protein
MREGAAMSGKVSELVDAVRMQLAIARGGGTLRRVAGVMAIGACAMASVPAHAQATQSSQARGALEEVIVTARYREESLQETPIAITAVSGEEIAVRAMTASYEIGYTVPNASLRPAQAAYGNTMSAYIRGIGQYDFLPEFEPGVGIYFDDVLHPVTMGSMVDLMDIERVEVLRGPQGTLFGRGSIGGAIRYVSKKPQGDDTGSISVLYGDFDRIDIRASYDFKVTDNLFARVTGVAKSRDGHQDVIDFACANPLAAGIGDGLAADGPDADTLPDQVTPGSAEDNAFAIPQRIHNRKAGCKIGTQGGENVTGARAALRYVASDAFEVTFTASFLDDDSEARADTLVAIGQAPGTGQLNVPFNFWSDSLVARYGVPFDSRFIPPNIYTTYATYDDPVTGLAFTPRTAISEEAFSVKADWKISEAVLAELIVAYSEFDSQFSTDADGSPYNEQTVDGQQTFDATTVELRFSGRAFDLVDWTVGAFYYQGDFTSAQQVSIPAFAAGPFLVNGLNNTESENISGFAHAVFDVTDALSLTAGVRYSEDTKDEQFDNTIVRTTGSASDSHFDWKLGIDYRFTDGFMLYASAATGYRPQAFNPRPFQITQFVPVDGEEATSYELGFKADLFDRRLRTNVAVFYIDYNQRILPVGGTECIADGFGNYVALVPAGTPGSVVDGLGQSCVDPNGPAEPPGATTSRTFYSNIPATIRGAELELVFRPVDGLTISGVVGYTDFEGDEFDDPSLLGPAYTDVFSDNPIFVPDLNWNISIAYEFAVGGGTITPRIDYYGQTEICPTITTNVTLATTTATEAERCADAYEIVNARIEWASPQRAWKMAVGVNNLADEEYFLNKFDLATFGQPTVEGQPGRPREWYVQLTRNFE